MAFQEGHALVIGIGSYEYMSQADVPVAARDARAVQTVLQDPDLCGYPSGQITLLRDKAATRAGILAALDALAQQTTAADTVLLYYCGHGEYGSDGYYYLTAHDTQLTQDRLKLEPGTGVEEGELLDKLRKVEAKRLLLLFNACHSGEISPSLGLADQEKQFGDESLSVATTGALLSTGEGRIVITASRPEQKSWIGTGQHTIYTQALIDGLRGQGYVTNNQGYISAYALYESMYFSIKDATKALGKTQEPELTVLKGVGPFPVSLYRGATSLGSFAPEESLSADTATRTVEPSRAERLFEQKIVTVTASGERAVAIGGDMSGGTIVTGDQTDINTGGGAFVGGDVSLNGGDFVGRDQIVEGDVVHGDKVGGDKVDGDKISIGGDVKADAIAIGRDATVTSTRGLSGEELSLLFAPLMETVNKAPQANRAEATQMAEELKTEVAKGGEADDQKVAGLISELVDLVPAAAGAVSAVFSTPAVGAAVGP